MSTVGKELQLVVLDVGPDMHPYLSEAARNLFNLATARLLNKPSMEMALIFYGTTETDNALNREMLAEGEEGQYTNIVVAQELQCVSTALMAALRDEAVPRGAGPSDWVNAVLLAIDMLLKADKKFNLAKYPRKLFLISTFTDPVDLDPEFRANIVESLRRTRMALEVVAVGEEPWRAPGGGEDGQGLTLEVEGKIAARDANMEALSELMSDVTGSIRLAPTPKEVAGMFQAVHKEGNAAYSGPFTLGTKHINVKVYKKTNPEPVTYNSSSWELKRYCAPKPNQARMQRPPDDECWVGVSRELRAANDLDGTVVGSMDTLPAYKYGKECIPVHEDEEELLGYHPEKGMALLGFVDAEGDGAVPFYYLGCSQTKGCFVVLGDKEGDAVAVSALARAMARTKRSAVVRVVFRARTGTPGLYLLTPLLAPPKGDQAQPQFDCLVMNRLPFEQDFRATWLPSLEPDVRKEVQPSPEQQAAMRAVVEGLDLMAAGPGGREALRPEDVVSPVQQRLYQLVGRKALDQGYKFPKDEGEALTSAVCDPPLERFPAKARAALEKLPKLFKTQVGTASPLEDFAALLEGGKADDAIRGMEEVIPRLVEESVGARLYPKAADCVARLRQACVALPRPGPFNDLLSRLVERFEGDPLHSAFAQRLRDARVTPISSAEVPAGTEGAVAPAAAEAFLRRGGADRKEAPRPADGQEEEDELADME
ncbi:ATP-dependent DNA helicase 2 subunit 2 [Monoraphidium neglectum]|uniref:ATP-dependent DNA helicase 2 subunit 2 n=1 Tax=Monoraphidium neglectum TaxID=145388 RepID=A0A0D2N7Y6_9CHLO|nr:ATP-dependent DNA helicase 2 subunit 2 [Monoraphidium neglectum]KIZ01921.1 ATP-dependent DNA helicase 2 subunit 2 [Monoraphidium neglectum]|eukprot:XP_013900940.1 ATP-dependent DNA helicase 2 subunit 2 [Monoraphidium neglectum]